MALTAAVQYELEAAWWREECAVWGEMTAAGWGLSSRRRLGELLPESRELIRFNPRGNGGDDVFIARNFGEDDDDVVMGPLVSERGVEWVRVRERGENPGWA